MLIRHGTRAQFKRRLVFLALLAVTLALALYPELRLPEPAQMRGKMDLVYHVLGFTVLAFLGGRAWSSLSSFMVGLVIGSVLLEFAQYFSPGRGVHWQDMVTNVVGIALGMTLLLTANGLQRFKASG